MRRFPVVLSLVMVFMAAGSAHADKLIVFKNGKAMRAQSVTKDGLWLKCEFDNKNFISVKASSVAGIEEAAVGSNEGELRTNKVAAGSGYTPPASQGFNPSEGHPMEMQQPPPPEEAQEGNAMAEEQDAIRRQGGPVGGAVNGVRGGSGFRSRFNQPQGNNPVPGLQPLGQNPNTLNNRRQLTPRDQQRRLSRFGQAPDQNNNQEGNQDN